MSNQLEFAHIFKDEDGRWTLLTRGCSCCTYEKQWPFEDWDDEEFFDHVTKADVQSILDYLEAQRKLAQEFMDYMEKHKWPKKKPGSST